MKQVSRPNKPAVDPLYTQVVRLLRKDNRSNYAKSQVSGLSSATFRNWDQGTVRHPQSVSLQMAARMLGYKIVLVEEPCKGKK